MTRDIDLLGFGDASEARLLEMFTDVLAVDVPNDGMTFDLAAMTATTIREEKSYGGIRIVAALDHRHVQHVTTTSRRVPRPPSGVRQRSGSAVDPALFTSPA